jgi:TonB family protein
MASLSKRLPWVGVPVLLLLAASGLVIAGSELNEGVTAPYLIPESRVAPEYPPSAFDARMEGQVVVAALVLKDGSVAHVETLDSSPPNLGFEQATTDAVKRWRFEPGQKDGELIDAFAVVRLTFRRSGGATPTGYVTAGFMPLEMLRASIVADATNPAGGVASTPAGVTMASVANDVGGVTKVGIPGTFYDPKSPWIPETEVTLDTSKHDLPDLDPMGK